MRINPINIIGIGKVLIGFSFDNMPYYYVREKKTTGILKKIKIIV